MSYFRVRLEAPGLHARIEGMAAPIAGFFATRIVRAPSIEAAERAASARVIDDWRRIAAGGEDAELTSLSVLDTRRLGWWEGVRAHRPSGFTFYASND